MIATKTRPTSKAKAEKSKPKRRRQKESKAKQGPILPGVPYPKWVFIETVGTTEDGFYAMIERGLVTVQDGKRTSVLGEDYHAYLKRLKEQQQANHDTASNGNQPASTLSGGDGSG